MTQSTGILYLVSTPIGNMEDLSARALRTLSEVSYILCESTDQTRKLGIPTQLFRYEGNRARHASLMMRAGGFKADAQKTKVLEDLRSGKNIALVSNAGTPNISDPGLFLVQAVAQEGLPVVHIPGPVAFVSAAVTSGLPTKNILFIGFLPKKEGAIQKKFENAKSALQALNDPASLICYVSKYQLMRALDTAKAVFGETAHASLAREMTKLYEEHKSGSIDEIIKWIKESKNREKGEFTLVVSLAH